jgi:hypothetical protein
MTDYLRITLTSPNLQGERTLRADENTDLLKCSDSRAPGAGVEVVRRSALGQEEREFYSIDRVASLIFAPRVAAPEKTK